MIRAVLAARRHETSADRGNARGRRDRLAFERIHMRAGALFAVGHGHAEVPIQAYYGGERWDSPRAISTCYHDAARRAIQSRFALARAVKALILLATA